MGERVLGLAGVGKGLTTSVCGEKPGSAVSGDFCGVTASTVAGSKLQRDVTEGRAGARGARGRLS